VDGAGGDVGPKVARAGGGDAGPGVLAEGG
jgi:hypothetical protein